MKKIFLISLLLLLLVISGLQGIIIHNSSGSALELRPGQLLIDSRQIIRYPVIAWQEDNHINVAIGNNTSDDIIFDIDIGSYYLQEPVTNRLEKKVEVPAKSVIVEQVPVVESVMTRRGSTIPARYVFIYNHEERDEIVEAASIQKREELDYTFTSFIIPAEEEAQFFILEPQKLLSEEVYYSIADKYQVEVRNLHGELEFQGISTIGLEHVSRRKAERDLGIGLEGHILKVQPKGAIFNFQTLKVKNTKIASIDIQKIEIRDEGIKRGSITSPEFLILGEDMELIK